MKILTANIALGLKDMDHLVNNVHGITTYHSWTSYLVAILCPPLRGLWGCKPYSQKRINYLRKHENLDSTFNMIRKNNPDILILNEVVPEIHESRFDKELKDMGFTTITYGLGGKYPDAHVSTLVATKEKAIILQTDMPQPPYPGCGGGIAGLRLESGVSIVGVHMALKGKVWREQLNAITALLQTEKIAGNQVIFAGDCNEKEEPIISGSNFSILGLVSADMQKTSTCPTSLPRIFQRSLDHIFIPSEWKIDDFRTIAFGSDHLALLVSVEKI